MSCPSGDHMSGSLNCKICYEPAKQNNTQGTKRKDARDVVYCTIVPVVPGVLRDLCAQPELP
eukprot:1041909-Prorocentrum_minimum.AAC.1